jgi:hypothetical protein
VDPHETFSSHAVDLTERIKFRGEAAPTVSTYSSLVSDHKPSARDLSFSAKTEVDPSFISVVAEYDAFGAVSGLGKQISEWMIV